MILWLVTISRKIKLSVDFHKFAICHWMSNAKENGAELISDSFVLQVKIQLKKFSFTCVNGNTLT